MPQGDEQDEELGSSAYWEKLAEKQQDETGESSGEQAWAHWEYTSEEWAQLDRLDWGRAAFRYFLRTGLGALLFLADIALLIWSFYVSAALLTVITFAGMFLFFILAIILIVVNAPFVRAWRRHKARRKSSSPHKMTLADKGIWQAGTFFTLNGTEDGIPIGRLVGASLLEVQLTSQPAMLHFRVGYGSIIPAPGFESMYGVDTIHLLVPAAHESEAERVAQSYGRLTAAHEKAREQAQRAFDSTIHPPEPD